MVLQGQFVGGTTAFVELKVCSCYAYCIAGYMSCTDMEKDRLPSDRDSYALGWVGGWSVG